MRQQELRRHNYKKVAHMATRLVFEAARTAAGSLHSCKCYIYKYSRCARHIKYMGFEVLRMYERKCKMKIKAAA